MNERSVSVNPGHRWLVLVSALVVVIAAGLALAGAAIASGPFPLVSGSPFLSGSKSESGTYGIAYSPNGKLVAVSNYYAGKVAVMAVKAGTGKLTLKGQVATGGNPQGIAYSPNGKFIAVVNYDSGTVSTLKLSSSDKPKVVDSVSLPVGETAAFNPAGTLLAVSDQSGNVTVFSVSSAGALSQVDQVSSGEGISFSLAFSPSGSYLAAVNTDSGGADPQATVAIFSVAAGGALSQVGASTSTGAAYNGNTGSTPAGVAFSPNGELLAVSDASANDVLMYSVSSEGALSELEAPTATGLSPAGIAFNPAGTLLATADSGTRGQVSIFTVGSGGSLSAVADEPVDGSGGPQSVAFSPSGDLLGVANLFAGAAGSVSEYDTNPAG